MTQINVFCKYDVSMTNEYSYHDEYGEFQHEVLEESYIIEGGDLLDKIASNIFNSECIDVVVIENEIHITHFSPWNGESENITIKFAEVKHE